MSPFLIGTLNKEIITLMANISLTSLYLTHPTVQHHPTPKHVLHLTHPTVQHHPTHPFYPPLPLPFPYHCIPSSLFYLIISLSTPLLPPLVSTLHIWASL
uniref:Uncharacterized protein n=1 Tax=Cacopsylla melanoneura TaxID=428564 RepID=A0A8D8ZEL1_9HEMI